MSPWPTAFSAGLIRADRVHGASSQPLLPSENEMGLNSSSAKVLCGVRFIADDLQSVAMIGRQHLVADPRVLDRIYSLHGTRAPPPSKFAEPFFEALGASVVHSIDASDFEGATHVHDMNVPICDALKGAYSLVFDGGTLEHIFDVP